LHMMIRRRKWCMTGFPFSPSSLFSDCIRKLVECWTKCVEKQGDYVENATPLIFHIKFKCEGKEVWKPSESPSKYKHL
jgi:hypothetical protein